MNPKVHHRIHNIPPPVPVLNHIDPVYVAPFNLSKIQFNIILPSTPESYDILDYRNLYAIISSECIHTKRFWK
jgi:hypothetical protein